MALEIERKFLIKELPIDAKFAANIKQGYITNTPDKTVRVRYEEKPFLYFFRKKYAHLVVKTSTNTMLSRNEFEYKIPVEDALWMLNNIVGNKVIEKTRMHFPGENKLVWEIDMFHGKLNGLFLAEIELPDENYKINIPDWVGKEVTYDPSYSNAALCENL